MDLTLQTCLSQATEDFSFCIGMSDWEYPNYAELDRVRALVIRHNFTSDRPVVWTLGRTEVLFLGPRSRIECFQSAMQKMNGTAWINTLKLVVVISLEILLGVVGVYYIGNYLKKRYSEMMAGRLYWYDRADMGIPFRRPIRLYNKLDFIGESFQISCAVSVPAILSAAFAYSFFNGSFFSLYAQERTSRYKVMQELVCSPSSMVGFNLEDLSNRPEDTGWTDPILFTTINRDQIFSPSILRVDQCAVPILSLLSCVFNKSFSQGEVPHPFLQDNMSPASEEKLIGEVTKFFSITEDDFYPFGDVNLYSPTYGWVTEREFAVAIEGSLHPNDAREFRLARKKLFLSYLPREIVEEYFSGFLG
ncbi:MAG: hypothetical protein LVR00_03820 [Rhabdochlamydiaceae bacterium]|jgi:hypothetical protein